MVWELETILGHMTSSSLLAGFLGLTFPHQPVVACSFACSQRLVNHEMPGISWD